MNTERLLREVERRLVGLTEAHRAEVLDALREEIGRERRRHDPVGTVEVERERRLEAETLREILEAIGRQQSLEETVGEVLKQLARLVLYDSCALLLQEPDASFRAFAVRGFEEPALALGQRFRSALVDEVCATRREVVVADVAADERFAPLPGCGEIGSWAGIPLLVEGQVLGVLALGRGRVEAFGEEDLHRAKAVAFSAAAVIRKAQLHEHLRRYAALMERLVAVDQALFAGEPATALQQVLLEGALRVGGYTAGLLVLAEDGGGRVAATAGDVFERAAGRPAPAVLGGGALARLDAADLATAEAALGFRLSAGTLLRVPLATPQRTLGALLLLSIHEEPYDRLLESYALRAAAAYAHAVRAR
ncbi:MAG: GAF domain-containing protein [Vicinamibacteria bacterium]|nr:GAF domain-containing protein [Vicinamibacteria bacterium]